MPFINRNVCKTFVLTCNGNKQNLETVFGSQECTEVIVRPRTMVFIYDDPNRPTVGFQLSANEEMTFRGINNIANLSATGANGGTVYFRTQFFGSQIPL
jgi:hypothetical protein